MKVLLTNVQSVYGLTSEQLTTLKEHLTFDNPKYKSAVRYSKARYISIPEFLFYYTEKKGIVEIPIGVDLKSLFPQETIEYEDMRECVKVEYPPFTRTLREDQQVAEDAYLKSLNDTTTQIHKSLIQLPTGKGKSVLALHLAYTLGVKTLVLVHKEDLVVGWKKDIEESFDGKVKSGLIKAKKREVGEHITIATVQTLARMSEEELSNYTSQFGLVVQDECHHCGLNIFNIIHQFNSLYKLGLSATPKRSDGLTFTFDLFFGGICHKHIITKDDKDILPVKVIVRKGRAKYRPFVHNGQVFNYYDFKEEDLPTNIQFVENMGERRPTIPYLKIDDAIVMSSQHKIQVCKDIIEEYRKGHSCIALFTQKEHINAYYKYLKHYIPKETIQTFYGDNKESSQVMMERAERRECLITLATLAKATEGTNVKAWEVEFLVSSLNNEKNVEQATGRVRRRQEGKLCPALVYDYVLPNCYSLSRHQYTRMKVYRALEYDIVGDVIETQPTTKREIFSRGY